MGTDVITLNVGGQRYAVLQTTLTCVSDSMLDRMIDCDIASELRRVRICFYRQGWGFFFVMRSTTFESELRGAPAKF